MAVDILQQPAAWGLSGAFIYAAPRFTTCLYASRSGDGVWTRCGVEMTVAIAVGTLSAAAVTPLIMEITGRDSTAWLRAIATMAGLLANRVAPIIINSAPDAVIEWLGRMFKKG